MSGCRFRLWSTRGAYRLVLGTVPASQEAIHEQLAYHVPDSEPCKQADMLCCTPPPVDPEWSHCGERPPLSCRGALQSSPRQRVPAIRGSVPNHSYWGRRSTCHLSTPGYRGTGSARSKSAEKG